MEGSLDRGILDSQIYITIILLMGLVRGRERICKWEITSLIAIVCALGIVLQMKFKPQFL